MMMLYCSGMFNRDEPTYATSASNAEGEKLLDDRYYDIMLDGNHRRHYVKMLRDKNAVEWTSESLRLHRAIRADDQPLSPAQEIKLSKIANISTAIVGGKAKKADPMQGSLSYVREVK